MIKVYGSDMCSKTRDFKYNLETNNIPYTYIDINESLDNMKEFLQIRDTNKKYNLMKEIGGIGIPTIVLDDGNVILRWDNYLMDQGIDVKYTRKICIDDSKNC